MLKIYNHYVSKIVFILLITEILVLFSAVYLGLTIRFHTDNFSISFAKYLPSACAFSLSIVLGMSALGMYQRDFTDGLRMTLLRFMPSFILGIGILTIIFYVVPDLYVGRGILLLTSFIAITGILAVRTLFSKLSESKFMMPRIIFLGGNELDHGCIAPTTNIIRRHGCDIVEFVPVAGEKNCVPPNENCRVNESLLETVNRCHVSEIVVALQNRRDGNLPIHELLECKLNGIQVIDAATFFERESGQIRLDALQPSWLIFGTGFDQSIVRTFVKRFFDLSVSAILLAASAPIMLFTALCIYLEDRSPIFYQQERVGKNGRSFMIYKFRSMRCDAEKAGKAQWATSNDPRTTRVGAIIRKFRIDELPQIINVFKGDMSFVGPRPERPFFVKQLGETILFYNVRHGIKPGITGWAQVRYQYGASVEDAMQKLQYDLYYVKNNSLFLDILILIDTLRVVMFGAGISQTGSPKIRLRQDA